MGFRRVETFMTGSPSRVDYSFDANTSMIGFDFTAATNTYRARYNGDGLTTTTTRIPSPTGYSFDSSGGGFDSFLRSNSERNDYAGYVSWASSVAPTPADASTRNIQRLMLFGARTVSANIPTAGSATFNGSTTTTFVGAGTTGESATVTIDFTARTFNVVTGFRMPALGNAGSGINPQPARPVTMSGTLDPFTGRVSGTVTLGDERGSFEGALYGPRAAEIGILFSIGTTASYFGQLLARR